MNPVKQPFVRVPWIILRHAASHVLQPNTIEFFLAANGRGHHDRNPEACVKRQLGWLGPKDVRGFQKVIEPLEVMRAGLERGDNQPFAKLLL